MKVYRITLPWQGHPAARQAEHRDDADSLSKAVCGLCPFEDCLLPEGGINGYTAKNIGEKVKECPMLRAKAAGWSAAEALRRGEELGLLEEVIF